MQYYATLKAKLIYVFSISDANHRGLVKIGDATLDEATSIFLQPNCKELKAAARKRIEQYTKTASIPYVLHHAELTMYVHNGQVTSFNDKEVHNVLLRSGIQRHDFSYQNQGKEWFECTWETAVAAIQAVKEGRSALKTGEIVHVDEAFELREEQVMAVDKTVTKFTSGGKNMLWNAKMRFGKTVSALSVVKEMGYKRTIIITHRPVVDDSWFTDFHKIFNALDGYTYGSRERGETFAHLEKAARKDPNYKYVYFASLQDLRGSSEAGGKYEKNSQVFSTHYDLVIIDEAHEGTKTELGQAVIKLLSKGDTCCLNLSGTPFNLLDDYQDDEIFTWDYVMEQQAKAKWDLNHFGDPNPYIGLPKMNIFTFDLGKVLDGFEDVEDKAFNFTEFFRVWTGDPKRDNADMPEGMEGRFVHEDYVRSFLDLIVKYDETSNYPYSTLEFRKAFRHSLWMVPGVKEAKALSALLKDHPIFGQFIGAKGQSGIINVAGVGDEEVPYDDALKLVRDVMGDDPEDTMTITLSCGKLTTGVTVPPWTAVMYLSGSHNTDAKAYMQTIFRVQSPYTTKDGKRKENCYVFDFAPDRTLKVLAKAAKVSERAKSTITEGERVHLGEFLNFCPVIGYNGTRMEEFNVEKMLEELKKAYISRVTKNGCDDPRLYNMEMLRKLDKDALSKFDNLHRLIGQTKANHATDKVDMAQNGLTDEEYKKVEAAEKKKKAKKELTEEEKQLLEEAKKKRDNANRAISILRGISIRLPLMMYGAELKNDGGDITLENFPELIDDQSWEEFMPRGVTKELFREFTPYYDPDMFRAVGRNYRDLVRQADQMAPLERVKAVAAIFDYFRNPDKETVLTPWRVVNMHIGDCIGGWDFYDEDTTTKLMKPKFNDLGEVTARVFKDPDTRILEINSKTGLYPLYMTYSVFAEKLQAYRDTHMFATEVPIEKQNEIWDEVLRNNIFVICKTEMAKSITRRTLRGFRNAKVNARYFEDLINKITNQPDLFLMKVNNSNNYWKNSELGDNMKFNAIVGNPPYQVMDGGGSNGISAKPVYHLFVNIAKQANPKHISMIMPSRWFAGGKGLDDFRESMMNDERLSSIYNYPKSRECFSNVDIAGGICYFLWDSEHKGACDFISRQGVDESRRKRKLNEFPVLLSDNRGVDIVHKVQSVDDHFLSDWVLTRNSFGFTSSSRGVDEPFLGSIKLISSDGESYVKKTDVTKNNDLVGRYKVSVGTLNPDRGGVNNASDGKSNVTTKVRVLKPNEVVTETYIILGTFDNEDEAQHFAAYIRTRLARYLIFLTLSSMHIVRDNFRFVPILDFKKSWSELELYSRYGLSDGEIAYIESMIRPMENTLFETDSLIDPEFANFELAEYGMKPGDRIVYTPTNTEVVVAEGNKVSVDGESYTLAEFTAKYMPRNKRSVSGVCQGPKYFSFNGMTLYKYKETFGK